MLRRFFIFLIFCTSAVVLKVSAGNDKDDISRKYDYFYLEAQLQKLNNNPGTAFNLLNHCIELSPERPEAYYDRALLLNSLERSREAIDDFRKAHSLNKSEKVYKKSLFYQTLMLGSYDEAQALGEDICSHSADLQIYSILLSIYSSKKDYDGMLRTFENIEKINGPDESITLAKMQIFERRGEKNRAFSELKKLSDSNPRNTSYKVMLGNWMLQNNRAEEAYGVYREVLDANPDDITANMSMLDYYRGTGRNDKADSLVEKLLINDAIPGDSKVVLMSQLIACREKAKTDSLGILKLFDSILSRPNADVEIAEMKAAYMSMKKMPSEQIIEALKDALERDPLRLSVRLELLNEFWTKQDFENVIKYSQSTEDYTPDDVTVYYFRGLAFLLTDRDDESLEAMRSGIEYVNDESNRMIVSDVYNIIGDILHSKGKLEESYSAYDSCLQYNDKNVECLNNYAYFLSIEGKDLDKAAKMSRETIVAEPNNTTYLDTYAWILFLQGRYDDAKVYMEQLLRNIKEGEDPGSVVYEHLGDVYSMNGEKEKALMYWNKARQSGSESKTLDKKISEGKYIPEKK